MEETYLLPFLDKGQLKSLEGHILEDLGVEWDFTDKMTVVTDQRDNLLATSIPAMFLLLGL